MMAATPFTNSIEVGTEAMAGIWPGLRAAEQSVLLGQVLVSGARPGVTRMSERAETGFTTATAVANRLVRRGVPFRTAHRLVGDAVRQAVEAGSTQLADFWPPGGLDAIGIADLDLPSVVRAHEYGGGPGAFADSFSNAVQTWLHHRDWLIACRAQDAAANSALAAAVRQLAGEHPPGLKTPERADLPDPKPDPERAR